ncbi:MAG: DMT family transporter, partial [Lachnospiraceae bacterium]|nr:DMT family transporter [Lachnospiraceae bacterium]
MNNRKTIPLQILALYLIWGFTWVVMRFVSGHATPSVIVFVRLLLSTLIAFVLCFLKGNILPKASQLPYIAASGFLLMFLHHLFTQTGTGHLGSGLSAVIDHTMPLWVTIIAGLTIGESLSLRKMIGVLFSIAGLIVFMRITQSEDIRYI